MHFGLDIPVNGSYADVRTLLDLAIEAEEVGWDGFFLQDVLYSKEPTVDPWVALTAIAIQTKRMRIGVFLTPIPRRRPWQLARMAVTLDHLSNGRLIFGAALGFQALDFTPFGEDYDLKSAAEKLDEGLEILKGLWSGEPFSFEGKHYQLHEVTFLPKPVQTLRNSHLGSRWMAEAQAIPQSSPLGWYLSDDGQSGDGRNAHSTGCRGNCGLHPELPVVP